MCKNVCAVAINHQLFVFIFFNASGGPLALHGKVSRQAVKNFRQMISLRYSFTVT